MSKFSELSIGSMYMSFPEKEKTVEGADLWGER